MSKRNGTLKSPKAILERLEKDAVEELAIFTQEVKNELTLILREYMPEVQKFVSNMNYDERTKDHINTIMRERVVEFKVQKIAEHIADLKKILEAPLGRKATQDAVNAKIEVISQWTQTLL